MSTTLETVLKAIGVDATAAKADLVKLDQAFAGQHGTIPDGPRHDWINRWFYGKESEFFAELGRSWEADISLPAERKLERGSASEFAKDRDKKKAVA